MIAVHRGDKMRLALQEMTRPGTRAEPGLVIHSYLQEMELYQTFRVTL